MKKYSVDNQQPVTITEIINDNSHDEEVLKSVPEIDKLEVSESTYIGIVEIKRVS